MLHSQPVMSLCMWRVAVCCVVFALFSSHRAVAGAVVEHPLPYGRLRHMPAPKHYIAYHCQDGVEVDGTLDEPCWASTTATDAFVDIVGPTITPWLSTTAKVLWDNDNLYIAAEMEDPRLFAYETQHDSIIFHDNDFEVFIDPDGDNWQYYELEVNAWGQVWDLLLIRPYRNGGPPVMNWETIPPAVPTATTGPTGWRPAQVAVKVNGSLNVSEGSTGWSVEMALPWSLLQQAANRQTPPAHGDKWRINFSRVHWNVTWSAEQQRYVKEPADQPGYNFVWSPQWQVQMHQPETWGYLQFSTTPVDQAPQSGHGGTTTPDELWPARALLMDVYHAQTLCWQAMHRFCTSFQEASRYVDLSDVSQKVVLQTTMVSFVAAINTRLADGSHMMVLVDQLGRLVQTPAGPDGTLTAYNPMEGSSTFPPAPSSSVHAAGSGPALQQEL